MSKKSGLATFAISATTNELRIFTKTAGADGDPIIPASSDGLEIHLVSANEKSSLEILRHAYDALYAPHFSFEKGGERIEKWIENLNNDNDDTRYIILVAGRNLASAGTDDCTVSGISVGLYFPRSDTGLMSYNLVAPDARGSGIGKKMFALRMQAMLDAAKDCGGVLRGVFAECNNPDAVNAEKDLIDPKKRLEIYGRLGGKIMPVPYICPHASDPKIKMRNMVLLAFPHTLTGTYPDNDTIRMFLWDSYIEADIVNPAMDEDFREMSRAL